MTWLSKILTLCAVALIVAEAQCLAACALTNCQSAEAPLAHCHNTKPSNKQQPIPSPCLHDLSIANTNSEIFPAAPENEVAGEYCVALVGEALQRSFHKRADTDISTRVTLLSSLSVLRI